MHFFLVIIVNQSHKIGTKPIPKDHIPLEQVGFRAGQDTVEQIQALTSYIEARYKKKKKILDLSAAYGTLWCDSLMLTCRILTHLLPIVVVGGLGSEDWDPMLVNSSALGLRPRLD